MTAEAESNINSSIEPYNLLINQIEVTKIIESMTAEAESNINSSIETCYLPDGRIGVIVNIAPLPEVPQIPEVVKTNKQIAKEALDKLKNNNCCYCSKIDNSMLARIQGRIAWENNNFHRPIFKAINNK